MRVIAGELKGRRLASPPRRRAEVRPTSDRVREAIFSILGAHLEGARVLDLYAGTGALAIEALSRGAAEATLVDEDISLATRNAAGLGLEQRCTIVRSDVLRFLGAVQEEWDLIFCDPPYRLADRLQAPLEKLIPGRLSPGGLLIAESAAREPLSLGLPLVDERSYGDTRIAIHSAAEAADA